MFCMERMTSSEVWQFFPHSSSVLSLLSFQMVIKVVKSRSLLGSGRGSQRRYFGCYNFELIFILQNLHPSLAPSTSMSSLYSHAIFHRAPYIWAIKIDNLGIDDTYKLFNESLFLLGPSLLFFNAPFFLLDLSDALLLFLSLPLKLLLNALLLLEFLYSN